MNAHSDGVLVRCDVCDQSCAAPANHGLTWASHVVACEKDGGHKPTPERAHRTPHIVRAGSPPRSRSRSHGHRSRLPNGNSSDKRGRPAVGTRQTAEICHHAHKLALSLLAGSSTQIESDMRTSRVGVERIRVGVTNMYFA